MIPVITLLNDLDNKLNNLASLNGQFIPDETKIDFLNKGQIKLILKKVGLNNEYQLGLDAFKKRYQDLQFLIVNYEKLKVTKTNDTFNSYTSDQTTLANLILLPIDLYILATKGNCKGRILSIIEIVKHGDIQVKLKSPHYKPDFKYQETLATISGNLIYTYPDLKNTFTIDSLFISYLRYPKQIDISGYTHLDNSLSVDQDCELNSYLENELIELVVQDIADAIGNQEVSQLSRAREKQTE